MMRKLICLFLVLLTLLPFPAAAQSQPQPAPPVEASPEPYAPDEFPEWSRSLRRAEIITLGLFPFMFLFSTLAYDAGRFFAHNFDSRYAPGFFGSAETVAKSGSDRNNVILMSISLSMLLAAVDYFIEQGKPAKARR
jgi:hypothetical protein